MSRLTSAAAWHALGILGVLVTAALLATRPLLHDDLFFHLRTGEMVARTWRVPVTDPFTHTVLGTPWTSHEWGFGLLLHAAHVLGGVPALVGVMPPLVVGLFVTLYLHIRSVLSVERLWLAAPLLLLGLWAAESSCLMVRAALLTTCFLAVLLQLLRRLRQRSSAARVVALVALFLVWANVHVGVVFGLFVLGLHLLQALFDRWLDAPRPRELRSLLRGAVLERGLLLCGCAAVTLLNPSGLDLWTFPLRINEILYHSGLVWSLGHFAAPRPLAHPGFFALFALMLAACLPLRKLASVLRDRGEPVLAQALGALVFLVLTLRSSRFILDFVVFALPLFAMLWGGRAGAETAPVQVAEPALRARFGRAPREAASAMLVLGALALAHPTLPDRLISSTTPVALARFMEREHIVGKMFNHEGFGGYLGWRLRQPVYWDGRNDVVLSVALEFAHAKDLGELIDRHQLDMLILNEGYQHKFGAYLAAHADRWALVYWDDAAALYLKRVPKFERLVAREYRVLRPFAVPAPSALERLALDDAQRAGVEREIARALSQNDESSIAWYLRGRLAQERGRPTDAYSALARSARLRERPDTLYHLGRAALALGKSGEAKALLERATAAVAP